MTGLQRMPVLFVGHGSPMNAVDDNRFSREWKRLGTRIEKPKAILSVSAHWFVEGTHVCTDAHPRQIYDMYGFPPALYEVSYPAQGSPALAEKVISLLGDRVSADNRWGIDHGSWSVLCRMYPECDVPVVQLSVDRSASDTDHFEMGRALGPLRNEGVLILASGNIVHNLRRVDWNMEEEGFPWAKRFDAAVRTAVLAKDAKAVMACRTGEDGGPAVPYPDHWAPLLYALGASDENDTPVPFAEGCVYGSLSMTSYLFS